MGATQQDRELIVRVDEFVFVRALMLRASRVVAVVLAALVLPGGYVSAEAGEGAGDVQSAGQQRISLGYNSSCVVVADDTIRCWGIAAGLDGAEGDAPEPFLSAPGGPPLGDVVGIAVGFQQTCVLLRSGPLQCVGLNGSGQAGIGSISGSGSALPVTVLDETATEPLAGVTGMSLGNGHVCAVLVDTTLRCWGDNRQGKLGNPAAAGGNTSTTGVQPSPIAVVDVSGAVLTGALSVAAADLHTCAVFVGDGSVRCWGSGADGRLGTGSSSSTQVPQVVALPAGVTAQAISANANGRHTCVVASDTGVYCWGDNPSGQIGNGTRVDAPTPQRVINEDGSALVGAVAVSAGARHSCALLGDGSVRCWGDNPFGQIGVGSLATGFFERAQVVVAPDGSGGPLTGARSMSVGTSHSCAILEDWSMVCWGWDREGQVGNGTQPAGTEWPTPVYVGLTDPLDRPPVADSQTVEVLVGAPETITLSGSDPDGDPLSFAVSTPPTGGTLLAVSAPTSAGFVCTATVVYTPNAGTPGDSFEFTVDDGFETSDPAAVTLPVAGNRTPTANNDPASTLEDTAVDIDVAGNDTDPDDNLNPSSAVAVAGPAKGTLTNNGDGTFTYTPDDNANGTDAFDYQICDTGELCDTATVSITIDPVPDDPIARPDAATAVEDGSVDVDVRFNDSDGDDDPLTVTEVSDPMHGTASLNPDQTVTYASDPDYCGGDTFTYTIDDGTGRTATATVNVDVDCVNDPPTITIGGPYDGPEGAAVDIASTVTDPDSTTNITWTYQTGAGIDPGATCDFADATSAATTLTCDDDGTFTVTATADDGVNPTASARADVVITNQAPRVDAGADQGVNPGTAVTVTATFTDDGSNDSHTARIDWADGNGAQPAAIGPSNTVTATFPGYDNGTVTTVTVEVCDDDLECGTDLVVVTTDLCDIRTEILTAWCFVIPAQTNAMNRGSTR